MKKLKKLQKRVEKVQKELDLPGSSYPRLKLEDLHAGPPYSAIRKPFKAGGIFSRRSVTQRIEPWTRLQGFVHMGDFFQEEDGREWKINIFQVPSWSHRTSWRKKKCRYCETSPGQKEYDSLLAEAAANNQWNTREYLVYVDHVIGSYKKLVNVRQCKKLKNCDCMACLFASAIARIATEICTPRPGHRKVVLIVGDAIKTNTFHGCRAIDVGPARAVYDYILANKMAVVVWGDEHRTSKLALDGHVARHPIQRQPHRLKKKRCRQKEHGIDIQGCSCFCSHEGCTEKRTYAHQCARHHKLNPKTVSGVVLTNNGQALNRDVSGAISIGCVFFASCLG